ncbi:hypothetical protein ATANTOWER_016542 [Ataeniobius toweri]|uniref:Uncharacterized protein n=1 Tax=Ataeniobius toweri TaxID=208326 RepID=A0ABU7B0P4_9TELE|nr:hypothetical protein [Ataeniobius toweri]
MICRLQNIWFLVLNNCTLKQVIQMCHHFCQAPEEENWFGCSEKPQEPQRLERGMNWKLCFYSQGLRGNGIRKKLQAQRVRQAKAFKPKNTASAVHLGCGNRSQCRCFTAKGTGAWCKMDGIEKNVDYLNNL